MGKLLAFDKYTYVGKALKIRCPVTGKTLSHPGGVLFAFLMTEAFARRDFYVVKVLKEYEQQHDKLDKSTTFAEYLQLNKINWTEAINFYRRNFNEIL